MELRTLERFALDHHGLVHRLEAERLGVSRAAWYRALDRRLLEPVGRNVARMLGSPVTREQRILAAVWSVGDDAVASHRTAAHLWGVDRPPTDPIDVIVPARVRHVTIPGVTVHRPRDLAELRPVHRRGIPVTRPARMLCDLGAVDDQSVYAALEAILVSQVMSARAARAALDRHAKRGRAGTVALRAALDRWRLHEKVPDSKLESTMAQLLHAEGLPPARFHAVVLGYEVDFLIEGTPVVIECDGWGSHGLDREQFEFDRARNAELLAAGHPVVHVTWLQVTRTPVATASRIRAVLRRWAPSALPADERAA